jgi:hypothetical protein
VSRRIETGTPGAKLGPDSHQEEYLGRLAGYVPTEIVGLYIAAAGMVPAAVTSRGTALWWIFAGCFALTPVYLGFATKDPKKGPLWLQILLATIAFPVWVFAMGGPFTSFQWYQGWIASIVLFFVTVIFGMVKPKLGS